MTKKEMLLEITDGLCGVDIDSRMKNSRDKIEEVYNYYLKTNKTDVDKKFCIALLTAWR